MTEQEILKANVLADPNILAFLVYADYLNENNQDSSMWRNPYSPISRQLIDGYGGDGGLGGDGYGGFGDGGGNGFGGGGYGDYGFGLGGSAGGQGGGCGDGYASNGRNYINKFIL